MARLARSQSNRMLAGVIGGIAKEIGIDAKWLRIAFIILLFATAFLPMAAIYIGLTFLLPNEQDY